MEWRTVFCPLEAKPRLLCGPYFGAAYRFFCRTFVRINYFRENNGKRKIDAQSLPRPEKRCLPAGVPAHPPAPSIGWCAGASLPGAGRSPASGIGFCVPFPTVPFVGGRGAAVSERILHEIRNTDKCIAEIAADYGFATPSYFTTFCKQYFGQTPTVLRRRSELLHSDSWGGRLSVAGPSVMDRSRETAEQASNLKG